MNIDTAEWGPRLYAHLEAHWRATGTNQNAWCYAHGIQASTVSRWGSGAQPTLTAMQAIAAALDVPMLDVLVVAGIVDRADVTREIAPAATVSTPEVAIANDPTLDDWQRRHMIDFLKSLRDVGERAAAERGKGRRVTGRKS